MNNTEPLPVATPAVARATLLDMVKGEARPLLALIVLHALAIGMGTLSPAVFGALVNALGDAAGVSNADDTQRMPLAPLLLLALLAAVLIMKTVLTWFSQRASWTFGENVFMRLRHDVVSGLLALPLLRIERAGRGEAITRSTNDIDAVSEAVRIGLPETLVAVLYLISTTISSFLLDWRLAIISVIGLPPLVLATRWYVARSQHAYETELMTRGRFDAFSSDVLDAVRTVDLFAEQPQVLRKLDRCAEAVGRAERYTLRLQTRWFSWVQLGYYLPFALVALVGGILIGNGMADAGTVVAVALNVQLVVDPLDDLVYWTDQAQLAWAAFRRIAGIAAVGERAALGVASSTGESSVNGRDDGVNMTVPSREAPAETVRGAAIDIDDVRLEYSKDEPVLEHVTLHIDAGEHVAFVGPSGAGKTTLAMAICGLLPCVGGMILVDGRPPRHAGSFSALPTGGSVSRSPMIVFVPQDGSMLHGTLRFNLQLADATAPDDELRHALQQIGAGELTDRLDEDLSDADPTTVQRVALARVLLAAPDVAVLDESTSMLGMLEADAIERALDKALPETTVITIAHRLHTAMHADRIVVFGDRGIVEQGAPAELVDSGGAFARMYMQEAIL
ncbi:MAG TPA: ABC transporter ATP-binding protein/permease [Bifidobacterium pullorum]|nr:ABC transporter ATP-binding protein/permease [Bifidobacterium pullorum]